MRQMWCNYHGNISAPGQPTILPEECSAENNSVTIAWQPYPGSVVDAYTLELDDGNGGDFRVRYVNIILSKWTCHSFLCIPMSSLSDILDTKRIESEHTYVLNIVKLHDLTRNPVIFIMSLTTDFSCILEYAIDGWHSH